MLGPLIGITTSIATTAAVGVARAGAAAVTGGRQAPVRRARPSNHAAIHQLIEALENERQRRRTAEAEVSDLRFQLAVAGEVIERLQR